MPTIAFRNRTIGLLGGSFNPAHEGHLHITLYALKALGMDEVWWLVSPHNPLKKPRDLAAYKKRLQSAHAIAGDHPRIRVLDIEQRAGLKFSVDTIAFLQQRFPSARFVWMMGADNLLTFHRWQRWQKIAAALPIVVFDRAPYSHNALRSKAYLRARRFLLKDRNIALFHKPPALQFVHLRRHSASATALRKTLGNRAFLGHNKRVGG